ncbi:MAG: hypothetical protein NTZ56_16630 [Acidobacteria bacterium]|nr:hypothetical protein [Acidobacteriota bacterium]
MNSWVNGAPNADPIGTQPPTTPLDSLAAEVDRQLVLDFGGEFLDGSGFESEPPEPDFETEVQGNA